MFEPVIIWFLFKKLYFIWEKFVTLWTFNIKSPVLFLHLDLNGNFVIIKSLLYMLVSKVCCLSKAFSLPIYHLLIHIERKVTQQCHSYCKLTIKYNVQLNLSIAICHSIFVYNFFHFLRRAPMSFLLFYAGKRV